MILRTSQGIKPRYAGSAIGSHLLRDQGTRLPDIPDSSHHTCSITCHLLRLACFAGHMQESHSKEKLMLMDPILKTWCMSHSPDEEQHRHLLLTASSLAPDLVTNATKTMMLAFGELQLLGLTSGMALV